MNYKRLCSTLTAAIFMLFCSCKTDSDSSSTTTVINAPETIRERAFRFAELYRDSDTIYSWGGQDPVRAIAVDCSGLVVMCYKYAIVDTKYSLLFNDASSAAIYEKYSEKTQSPQRGDLIFMGSVDSDLISHIAIFDREDQDGNIHFIDSTERTADSAWPVDVNGVSERYYHKTNTRIKAYGVMKVSVPR